MTEAKIDVPESLRFYFGDKANQAAVDQVLEGPAQDFNWKDLDEFYDAWLSAQKVWVDYWRFLGGVWEKVWGEALDQYFPT